MKYTVPFVPNTSDDMHCLNASYMMIAKYFDPTFEIPMEEWAVLTGFEPGKGTWANAGMVWFHENGYDVSHTSLFDYQRFIEEGEGYLLYLDGNEVGQWMIDHTNMPAEIARTRKLVDAGLITHREPTQAGIKLALDKGYLVRANLNAHRLDGRDGYVGHAVVVIGYDENGFILHDPGLPGTPNRHVTYDVFESAWADPNAEAKELDAIRKPAASLL